MTKLNTGSKRESLASARKQNPRFNKRSKVASPGATAGVEAAQKVAEIIKETILEEPESVKPDEPIVLNEKIEEPLAVTNQLVGGDTIIEDEVVDVNPATKRPNKRNTPTRKKSNESKPSTDSDKSS